MIELAYEIADWLASKADAIDRTIMLLTVELVLLNCAIQIWRLL